MSANRRLTGFSPSVREIIRARASRTHTYGLGHGAVCEVLALCQGAEAVHMHHRRPRGAGGSRREDTNLAGNSLYVCAQDHSWIELNRKKARDEFGWLISQFDSRPPSAVPVMYRGKFALLGNDGGVLYVPAPVRSA